MKHIKLFENFILNESWPAWKPDMDVNATIYWNKAAGNTFQETGPGWFEEAGKTFDALETEIKKLGCTKESKDLGQYMTWEHWLSTTGFGNALKIKHPPELEDWNKNVVPNNKSATWKTPDGKMLLHVSTLESFDDWIRTGKEGLTIMICAFNPAHSKGGMGSCVDHYLWNIGDPVRITAKK